MTKFRMDTHMHFDLYEERINVLDYIEKLKLYTIAVTNLPDLYERYLPLTANKKYVRIALGFHPELAQQYAHQIETFDRCLFTTRFVGEIGLDYTTKDGTSRATQDVIFSHIVKSCNQAKNKILTVHSRRAERRTMEILNDLSGCNVIMHWFSGSLSIMDEAIERGYYFSVNHQMLKSANGRKIIEHIPTDKLLIESDAPFTTGMGNKYSTAFIDQIYRFLCDQKEMTEMDMSSVLRQNFKSLLTTFST